MSGDEDAVSGPPLTPRGLLAGIKAARALVKGYRQQLDDGSKSRDGVVLLNDRSRAIVARARELAVSGIDDRTAVAELVSMAQGHEFDLRVAAAELQRWRRDSRAKSRAWRIAQGAVDGGQIPTIRDEDKSRFDALDEWQSLTPSDRFAVLVAAEPKLGEIADLVRNGRHDQLRLPDRLRSAGQRSSVEDALANALGDQTPRARLILAVGRLLGPSSGLRDHPIAGARQAANFAVDHLIPRGS